MFVHFSLTFALHSSRRLQALRMTVKGRHKWPAKKTIKFVFILHCEQIFTENLITTFTDHSLIDVWEVYLLMVLSDKCVILKNTLLFLQFCCS